MHGSCFSGDCSQSLLDLGVVMKELLSKPFYKFGVWRTGAATATGGLSIGRRWTIPFSTLTGSRSALIANHASPCCSCGSSAELGNDLDPPHDVLIEFLQVFGRFNVRLPIPATPMW